MKQSISKKQWDELSEPEKLKFFDEYYTIHGVPRYKRFNIMNFIEYLGEDLISMDYDYSPRDVDVNTKDRRFKDFNLCDALWQAVKYKLNNKLN